MSTVEDPSESIGVSTGAPSNVTAPDSVAPNIASPNVVAPNVVALGGGHGLAASLQAARHYAGTLAGIVSVADDGGSSGKIRRDLGIPAPGDIRRCLSALAGDDSLLAVMLEHRFDSGELEGHPIGNLLIAGLANATGDFQAAIAEVARLVGAHGDLYPATVAAVTLVADSDSGPIRGQVTIEQAPHIHNVRFEPPDPSAPDAAIRAILDADQVIIGPGSLFTSVLAVASVPDIRDAISQTSAQRVFVANVANDKAELRGFDLPEHLDALAEHGVAIDVTLAPIGTRRTAEARSPVHTADVAAAGGWSHDPEKLGSALRGLLTRYGSRPTG